MKRSSEDVRAALAAEAVARPVLPLRVVGPGGFVVDAATGERIPERLKRDATACFCPEDDPGARQEDRGRVDVNAIMDRFLLGGQPLPTAPYVNGIVDYDAEFKQLADSQVEAKQAFERLPLKHRRGYANWAEFMAGVAAGDVEVPKAPAEPQAVPAAPSGADGGSGGTTPG